MNDNDVIDSFSWRIENYSSHPLKPGEALLSSNFKVNSWNDHKFYLMLYPAGEREGLSGEVGIYLCKHPDTVFNEERFLIMDITLYNVQGLSFCSKTLHVKFDKISEKWGWSNYMRISVLNEHFKKFNSDTLTVRCTICRLNKDLAEFLNVVTRIIAEEYSFEWKVQLLKSYHVAKERRFFCLENIHYEIEMFIPGDDVSINIYKRTKSYSPFRLMQCNISLLNAHGIEILSKSETHTFDSRNNQEIWRFPSFITKKQLLDNENEYVKNGTLTFLCEFLVLYSQSDATDEVNSGSDTFPGMSSLLSLHDDFRCLLASKTNSDVTLRVNHESEFKAHRCVLAARSPVFSAMFEREMRENRNGVVDISDVDTSTLESFLKFLYTGAVECMDFERACKLLIVADKYQVPSLKEECSIILKSSLSSENVCKILMLADMVHLGSLKAIALDYAASHAAEVFTGSNSSNWIKENSNLAAEIFACLGKNKETT